MMRRTTTPTAATTPNARAATATTGKQLVVNWGGTAPIVGYPYVLNKPENVRAAINKLAAFQKLVEAGVRVPAHRATLDVVRAGIWLARTVLDGSGGRGIVVIRKGDSVPPAPLYVEYIPKQIEYRVHVFQGRVIFAQQKKRRLNDEQDRNEKLIRNYDNGWVFCPVPVEGLTEDTKNVAIGAVAGLGLDFGACDLVIHKHTSTAYALEVNSAPGLESPGLIEAYTEAFHNAYMEMVNDTTSQAATLPSRMEEEGASAADRGLHVLVDAGTPDLPEEERDSNAP